MSGYPFLSLQVVQQWEPLAKQWGVSEVARSRRGFLRAYERAGSPSKLPVEWKRKRDAFIARHMAQMAHEPEYRKDGLPTRRHLALIMWAYSPDLGKATPNPLVQRAPAAHSRGKVGEPSFFRVFGRMPTAEEFDGVHTANFPVAASYAMQLAYVEGGVPAVVAINIPESWKPVADVDSIVAAAEAFDDTNRRDVQADIDRGRTFQQIEDAFDAEPDPYEHREVPVAIRAMHTENRNPIRAAIETFGPEEGERVLRRWLAGDSVPAEVGIALTSQARYLRDIPSSMVESIFLFRPFPNDITDAVNVDDPDDADEVLEAQSANGLTPLLYDELDNQLSDPQLDGVTLTVQGPQPGTRTEYHGTTHLRLLQAFPEIADEIERAARKALPVVTWEPE